MRHDTKFIIDPKLHDNQSFFTAVKEHLLRQGRRCADEEGCRYHGPNNLSCAIGSQIPDSLYSPGMEGLCANAVVITDLFPNVDVKLMCSLQRIHDEYPIDSWPAHLFHLTY